MTAINLNAALRFLSALTGQSNPRVTFQAIPEAPGATGAPSHWTGTLGESRARLQAAQDEGCGVFFVLNETDGNGRRTENVTALRGWAIDCERPDVGKPLLLPPSAVVRTARGPHVYWFARFGEPLDSFTPVQKLLAAYYDTDPIVHDLPRVFRLPGSWHLKGDAGPDGTRTPNPREVKLEELTPSRRYSEQEIRVGLVPPTATPTTPRVTQRGVEPRDGWFNIALEKARSRNWADGVRHYAAKDTAAHCRKLGLSEEDTRAVLIETAETQGLPEKEVEKILSWSVANVTAGETGTSTAIVPAVAAADAPPTDDATLESECARLAAMPSMTQWRPLVAAVAKAYGVDPKAVVARIEAIQDLVRAEQTAEAQESFPISLAGLPWHGDLERGIFVKREKNGVWQWDQNDVVLTRPAWPAAVGRDVSTDQDWVLLRYKDHEGRVREGWHQEVKLKDRSYLAGINGLNATPGRINRVADYLSDSLTAAPDRSRTLTTHLGWVKDQWMLESTPDISYIGDPFPRVGDLTAWSRGVTRLLTQGEAGYTGLFVLAVSLGAPFTRYVAVRCPTVGLIASTSSGKGSVVNYALSAWMDPNKLTIPANSTIKGHQDRAFGFPDGPLFLEELHTQRQDERANSLYFAGNGQQRVTSSAARKAVGGARRYGSSIFASETDVLSGLHAGVGMRVVELDGPPCPDATTARLLAECTREHGALLTPLATAVNHDRVKRALGYRADYSHLHGDDSSTFAIVKAGAEMLSDILGISHDWIEPMIAWVLERHGNVRATRPDSVSAAWTAMLEIATGAERKVDDLSPETTLWLLAGEVIARSNKTNESGLDINTRHPRVKAVLDPFGGEIHLLSAWREKGWLMPGDGRHAKVKTSLGRVLRVRRGAPLWGMED